MASKNLGGKEVVLVSDDDNYDDDRGDEDEDDDNDNEDDDKEIMNYIQPVKDYKQLETRLKHNPYFLRRCLSYIIKSKKKKKLNSGVTIRFNYRNVRNKKTVKAEDVENFTCPFCLIPCGGYDGLRFHLKSSHDAFNFVFYRAEEDHGPEVDVSVKLDTLRFGVIKDDLGNPQLNPFTFCSKHRTRRRQSDGRNNVKRINIRLMKLVLEELPHGTDNEPTNVNNDVYVSSPPRPQTSEKTNDILTTAQPAISESSEPRVLRCSTRKKSLAESSGTMVPSASTRKKLLAASPEPVVPSVSTTKKLLAGSLEAMLPSVSKTKKLLLQSSEAMVPTVSKTNKLLLESSEPVVPSVSKTNKLLAESSGPMVPSVSMTNKLVAVAGSSEPKVPRGSRRKKWTKVKGIESLKNRQFYHSHTMQPMTFEEVMSNEDSENETDDDALDFLERLRLDHTSNLSKEEKRYMYLWNIFVRKHRVIADKQVPWACEEFTKLHKEEMKGSTSFDWWWRRFRITLWKHGLICANTFNKCTMSILKTLDEEGPSTSHGPVLLLTLQSTEADASQN